MPKKKEPPRTRAEQERAFREAAKASGADVSGKAFETAIAKIIRVGTDAAKGGAKLRRTTKPR